MKRSSHSWLNDLRRDPHLRLGVKAMQVGRLFFQERQEDRRVGVAGVAAGDEDGVDPRQLLEDVGPFVEGRLHGRGLGVVGIHRRVPDPDVEPVLVQQPRHLDHHLHLRQWEMRAVGRVVGARRQQLDRVGAEDRQVADVLLPHRHRPGVVRIRLRAIAELMSAQAVLRSAGDVQNSRDEHPPPGDSQLAQQPTDAEQHSARIVAGDHDDWRFGVDDAKAITLGGVETRQFGHLVLGHHVVGEPRWTDEDDRSGLFRPAVRHRPAELRAFFDLLDQHPDGLRLGSGQAFRHNDDGSAQVERFCGLREWATPVNKPATTRKPARTRPALESPTAWRRADRKRRAVAAIGQESFFMKALGSRSGAGRRRFRPRSARHLLLFLG